MKIMEYVKAHPWATGIIVVVGGFVFLMIFRGGSSDSGGSSGDGYYHPSDAEIAANAQVAAAQIAANAQTSQAGAAVQAAQVGANVQMNSDNKAAEVYMAQINAAKELGLKDIDNQWHEYDQGISLANAALGVKGLDQASRTAILQNAIVGGQISQVQYSPGKYNATGNSTWFPQAGNTAGGIIGSIGGLASSLGSIFSDQRLKENIKFLGYDDKGLEVYEWNYKGSRKKHIGYIAQSVARSNPEAIVVDPGSGYWKVNYQKLAHV